MGRPGEPDHDPERDPDRWGPPLTDEEAAAFAGAAEALTALPSTPADELDDLDGANGVAGEGAPKGGSPATQLVDLAHEHFRILVGPDDKTYAVDLHGPAVAIPLHGKKRNGFRARLARRFYETYRQTVSGGALDAAMTVLEGTPMKPEPVALRVATAADGLVLDLGTPDGAAIHITPTGWRLVNPSPVLFRRTGLIDPIPTPIAGGTLDGLRRLMNVDDTRFRLIVAWVIAALFENIPHPVLTLLGEQGTAKSTAAEMIVSLIDPSPAPLRTPPRDARSWSAAAAAGWTVALDNVSTIPPWFSDTLCKAVTGDGVVDRSLYTDDDVNVLRFRRCVALTSIDAGALAGDLAERLLIVELDVIPPNKRRPVADILNDYHQARPAVLGAVLDLATQVLAALPGVKVDQLPRMADFARILAALDTVTGWTTLDDYRTTAAEATAAVLEADPLAQALLTFARRNPWQGTAGQLLNAITPDRPPRDWPATARKLSGDLRRIAPALRANGITVTFDRANGGARQRLITLATNGSTATPSQPSLPSQNDQ
jgi:hypothetical protein